MSIESILRVTGRSIFPLLSLFILWWYLIVQHNDRGSLYQMGEAHLFVLFQLSGSRKPIPQAVPIRTVAAAFFFLNKIYQKNAAAAAPAAVWHMQGLR